MSPRIHPTGAKKPKSPAASTYTTEQWQHDILALLDERYPPLPERKPGDIAPQEYAAARGLTLGAARYRLDVLVESGELMKVQVASATYAKGALVYRRKA